VVNWAMICLAKPWVQLFSIAGNGWLHNAPQYHELMPISCHLRDCKALLGSSLTCVSSAVASTQTFTFMMTDVLSVSCHVMMTLLSCNVMMTLLSCHVM